MSQEDPRHLAPAVRVRANDWGPMGGPILPGEREQLNMFPAAAEAGNPPPFSEAYLLRMLTYHYRWGYLAPDMLRRYNPFGRDIKALVEGAEDA